MKDAAASILANYTRFLSDSSLYGTIGTTPWLAPPVTLFNIAVAVPNAMRVRVMRRQRLPTTILVVPITLGTVFVTEGMLNPMGPQGWLDRALPATGLIASPLRIIHGYRGVFVSILIAGFPVTFPRTLSYHTGIDPVLGQAAATLGGSAWRRFRHVPPLLVPPGLTITFRLLIHDHSRAACFELGDADRGAREAARRGGATGVRHRASIHDQSRLRKTPDMTGVVGMFMF